MSSQCVCRLCGERLTQTFVDLGMSPLCESYVSADAARPARDLLPAARASVLVLPPRATAGSTYRVRRSSPTTRTSRRTRIPGSPTPSGSRIRWSTDSPSRRTASSPRSQATTGTSCSTSWPGASPSWASSRRRTWPRWRSPGASQQWCSSSAQRPVAISPSATGAPILSSRTTSSRTFLTSGTSRQVCEHS